METRLARADDAAALAALHADSFGAACWTVAQIRDSLASPAVSGWIAPDQGSPQAFILCQQAADEAEILTFCVAPAARRQGIGAVLLAQACRAAQDEKAVRMFLEVAADNDAALALYRGAGFARIGLRPDYYERDGHAVDAVMLQKVL